MFENLKFKVNKLFNPDNDSYVARYVQDLEFSPDSESRNAQMLFWKLMAAAAFSNENLDDSLKYLFEDYIFEQCITEKEWKEIDDLRPKKPSKQVGEKMIMELSRELMSAVQTGQLFSSIESMLKSDEILIRKKQKILLALQQKTASIPAQVVSGWMMEILDELQEKKSRLSLDTDSEEYIKNPVACILRSLLSREEEAEIDVKGAKLGLALMIIYSDSETKGDERDQFKSLIKKYLNVPDNKVASITFELMKLPEDHLEMAYLGRYLVDHLRLDDRKEFLKDLFLMARSDGEYNPLEDRDLRVISKYLFLEHEDFIEAKISTKKG